MKLKIAVLAGDGIGPEIMEQGVAVMSAVAQKFGHEVSYKEALCGASASIQVWKVSSGKGSPTSSIAWAPQRASL